VKLKCRPEVEAVCTYVLFRFGLFASKVADDALLSFEQRIAGKRAEDSRLPLRRTYRHEDSGEITTTGSGRPVDRFRPLIAVRTQTGAHRRVGIALHTQCHQDTLTR
jgi:hypothetical protein